MVRLDDVTDLMDQMMKVEIFLPSKKLELLKDDRKTVLDPNLVMETRHKMFREDFSVYPTESSASVQDKSLLMQEEEMKKIYLRKEQEFLEKELRKFEKELRKSRPKFLGPYTCRRQIIPNSDDDDFWSISKKVKSKDNDRKGNQIILDRITAENGRNNKSNGKNSGVLPKISGEKIISNKPIESESRRNSLTELEPAYTGNIKVTIKDKSRSNSKEENVGILRQCFQALKQNARDERRLREIKMKIQRKISSRITRKYFNIWKTYYENMRRLTQKRKEEREVSDERKIEMFINAITEKQRELTKSRKLKPREDNLIVENTKCVEIRKKSIYPKKIVVESPAQSRLIAQKQIIEKQRAKLAEQNRIIEELRLKQAREEISKASKETINAAKETLTQCGQQTRRTLIQLMRQNGYRDKSAIEVRIPTPPKFLLRMEARAEARKERIKLAEEARRKKFEEQKRKEEATRLEQEAEKKRLQQEALREARRLREEKERVRLEEIERTKKLNNLADEFYRKYLLRHYLLEPLQNLVELRKDHSGKADHFYERNLLRKVFYAWKENTENEITIKMELASFCYNKNIMSEMFKCWKEETMEVSRKWQVAKDWHDMKLLTEYFKLWQVRSIELKAEYEKKSKMAQAYYHDRLRSQYFGKWKRFLEIAEDVKESEKKKDELRQIVQEVIPDFNPKQRGVAIED